MFEDYLKLDFCNVIYLLLVEPGYYKFGITRKIYQRLHRHKKTLNFSSIVKIFHCPSRSSSFRVEQKFKKYAKSIGILVNRYGQTEIINCNDIDNHILWFEREVESEKNNVGELAIVDDMDFTPKIPRVRLPILLTDMVFKNWKNDKIRTVKRLIFPKKHIPIKLNTQVNKVPAIMNKEDMKVIKCNKCYNCGKEFRDSVDYTRHKNRKTPCLIREISEQDKNNPNRCIYCNKVLSKKEHLTRHLTKCKVKNGGLKTLYDKVKHEEDLRIIREKHDQEIKKITEQSERRDAELDTLKKEMEEIRKMVGNNTVVNGNVTVNNTVNIVINNYNTPSAEHLLEFDRFRKMLGSADIDFPVELALNIYYDPSHPENASIHLIDQESKHVIAMADGRWNTFGMETIVEMIREVGYKYAGEVCRRYAENNDYPDRQQYIKSKLDVIGRFRHQKISPKSTAYELSLIEEKITSEFIASSKHPAVIAENTRRKRAIADAKKGIC